MTHSTKAMNRPGLLATVDFPTPKGSELGLRVEATER